ncbi:poly-beta-1,6 N-acetyl-D-glucosamine export porin PgaA [Paenalcaligenes niemegkensis]|uniref:poly-beta-1,6 N-acetyl-D-glucosamine export porin PgaA n=1 Tax=Paenalcaligenes niemegkensis TaxID=2895469 RepID=UPI001EE84F8E|nr:poly-beta-1,6 N-acetyl-D-glucosamine export porin PgaA [Paenalcaligenes niemegkensis]MCQ9616443.1 poly-beta-1,6 N-acetyl-D-glucosamine export porin PgaA [Paenalcaligenes niemegkensis]
MTFRSRVSLRAAGMALVTIQAGAWAQALPAERTFLYQQAIENARQGRYEQALSYLKGEAVRDPRNDQVHRDLIVVQQWAGQYQKAIQSYENRTLTALENDPLYVRLAAANAYLANQQAPKALVLATKKQPAQEPSTEWLVIELLALTQMNQMDALRRTRNRAMGAATTANEYVQLSHLFMRTNLPHDALKAASRAVQLEPSEPAWKINYAEILHRSGSPRLTLDYVQRHGVHLSTEEQLGLEIDATAELTRQSVFRARNDTERHLAALEALREYEQLDSKWSSQLSADRPARHRLAFDRLLALHAAGESRQVVSGYETLIAEGATAPDYVLDIVASSYLSERKPERAAQLYESSTAAARLTPEAKWLRQLNQNYIYQESDQYKKADQVLAEASSETPTWLHIKGKVDAQPNMRFTDTQVAIALRNLYSGNAELASLQLKEMLDQAPANSTLRVNYADALRAQGLSREAEGQLKIIETTEPLEKSLLLTQGHTALDLSEWRQARSLVTYLNQEHPEDISVQQLNRRWETYQLRELQVSGGRGFGPTSTVGGDHGTWINTKLYSPPIADSWRPFVGYQLNSGKFDEQSINVNTVLAGVQWQSRDNLAEVEVNNQHYRGKDKIGTRFWWEHNIGDHWLTGVQLATHSLLTPLRGLNTGVHGKRADLYLQWQSTNQNQWRVTFSPSRFSDGNNRREVVLGGQTRLMTRDHVLIDGMLEASFSSNSLGNTSTQDRTAYFNPKRDYLLLPKVGVEQLLYQRYDQRWSHRLEVGAGTYYQKSYGSDLVISARYRNDISFSDRLSAGLGVEATRRPYDGKKENNLNLFLELNWRF